MFKKQLSLTVRFIQVNLFLCFFLYFTSFLEERQLLQFMRKKCIIILLILEWLLDSFCSFVCPSEALKNLRQ